MNTQEELENKIKQLEKSLRALERRVRILEDVAPLPLFENEDGRLWLNSRGDFCAQYKDTDISKYSIYLHNENDDLELAVTLDKSQRKNIATSIFRGERSVGIYPKKCFIRPFINKF